MTVVVILGFLAGIAVGVVLDAREKAGIRTLESDLSHAYKASVGYFGDNPDGELTLDILPAYGYAQSKDVSLEVVEGTLDALRITGTHLGVVGVYEVNKDGEIFRQ